MLQKRYCWDELKCFKTECPAYKIKKSSCWHIHKTLCNNSIQYDLTSKIEACLKCKIFLKNITVASLKKTLKILSLKYQESKKETIDLQKSEKHNKNKANTTPKSFFDTLQDIIEFMPDPTFAIDNDKKVIAWNKAIEKMTGLKKSDIIGKGDYAYAVPFYGYRRPMIIDLLNAPDESLEKTYMNFKREADSISGEVLLPSFRKNEERHIWAIASPIYSGDKSKLGAIESIRDITELRENEKMVLDINTQLRDWANNLEKTTRDLATLNSLTKMLQECTNINEAYDIISYAMMELFPAFSGCIFTHNDKTKLFELVSKWGDYTGENPFNSSKCWASKWNRIYISTTTKKKYRCNVVSRDFKGGYICIPLVAHGKLMGLLHLQITKEFLPIFNSETTDSRQQFLMILGENISLSLYAIKLRETLTYQAIRDPLTDLFNRRYMEETLKRELQRASRRKSSVGIIMFDIDYFKKFNDTFGHEAGDTMLREIASFVKSNIRAEDIISRYGGEEFLITMPDVSVEIAKARAEKLRVGVKELDIKHKGQSLGAVTISFGVATFPEHANEWEALIKAADDALYKAKAQGRDKVCVAG